MTKRFLLSVLFALLLLAAPSPTQAQTTFELGPRVGYEVDQLEEVSLGADLRVSTVQLPFQLNGTFDYYFASDDFDIDDFDEGDEREEAFTGAENVFRFTANGLYQFGFDNQVFTPYAGPGLSVTRISYSDESVDFFEDDANTTELGLNVVGGAEFRLGNLRPFVQAEFVVSGNAEPAQVTGGLLFNVGGN